jgi:NADH:ubiquinone oxidoreductase subunit C
VDEQAPGTSTKGVEDARARLLDALSPLYPDVEVEPSHGCLAASVPVDVLKDSARILRNRLGYRLLSMVTAVDYLDRIEVIYLVFSLDHAHGVFLQTSLPREGIPDCPTLTDVWPGAEFQEREVYDLMGINFVGHPDLRRILTEDDFPGHPLRKDFSIEPDYVLMRHLRYGADGQFAPPGVARD